MKFWPAKMRRQVRRRIAHAERAAARNENRLKQVEAQWDEVRELSGWATDTTRANHLTELFINGLSRKQA